MDESQEHGDYRPDYGKYAPDWIPEPDGVSAQAWDRYLASQPGSDKHKAAYMAMHQEVNSRGFPGSHPDESYLADHGYMAGADRPRTLEEMEGGFEPADAVPVDRHPERDQPQRQG